MTRVTVSIDEAARIVGVERRTIHYWIADGKVAAVRVKGGAVRIYADTLQRSDDAPGQPSRPDLFAMARAKMLGKTPPS